jgi:hypothetical protein
MGRFGERSGGKDFACSKYMSMPVFLLLWSLWPVDIEMRRAKHTVFGNKSLCISTDAGPAPFGVSPFGWRFRLAIPGSVGYALDALSVEEGETWRFSAKGGDEEEEENHTVSILQTAIAD